MIKDEYSPYKLVHHPDVIAKLRSKEHFAPLQVHVVPTNRCNQNCSFCAYRMHGYSSSQNFGTGDVMPSAKLMETINSCANMGVKALQYTGGGEPTVHPNIEQAFELTYDCGLELALVSNGVNWSNKTIELLAGASWVRVSVDAFSPALYSKTRRVPEAHFHKMLANLKALAKTKEGVLGVGFVITKENWQEVYQACRLFKEIGVDNFRISAAFTDKGLSYFDGWFEDARDLVLETVADFNDDNFTVFNLFNDRISDLFDGVQNYDFCGMKNLVPYIGADQIVYTCCTLAYNDLGVIGSIKDCTFEELWFSADVKEFLAKHNPRHRCRLPCMFEKKNEFIEYCIKSNPKHTAFI